MNEITLYDFLSSKGFEVYFINKKTDKCNSKYIVIKDMGQSPQFSNKVGNSLIHLILYIPSNNYSSMRDYSIEITRAMNDIDIRKTGNETPIVFDDVVEGYTKSIEYIIPKKLL